MYGAIAGDIIGSVYEINSIKSTTFELFSENCHFTDDTVLTIAVTDALLNKKNYTQSLQKYGKKIPQRRLWWNFFQMDFCG